MPWPDDNASVDMDMRLFGAPAPRGGMVARERKRKPEKSDYRPRQDRARRRIVLILAESLNAIRETNAEIPQNVARLAVAA